MSEKTATELKKFLDDHAMRVTDFARAAEISRFSVYKYLNGSRISPFNARKIERKLIENRDIFLSHKRLLD